MDERRIVLNGVPFAYTLKRSFRRSIGFAVSPTGLQVAAPRWVLIRQIESVLQERAAWIIKKTTEIKARETAKTTARSEDKSWTAAIEDSETGDSSSGGINVPYLGGHTLMLVERPAAEKWLQSEAKRLFTERLAHYQAIMGVRAAQWGLSNAKTRWGSASSAGHIRLNWKLIQFSLQEIDYVIVHELAHLTEMNHSARFWAIVAGVLPDYKVAQKVLKSYDLRASA